MQIVLRMRDRTTGAMGSCTVAQSTAGGAAPVTSNKNHSQISTRLVRPPSTSGKHLPSCMAAAGGVAEWVLPQVESTRDGSAAVSDGARPLNSRPESALPHRSAPKSERSTSIAGRSSATASDARLLPSWLACADATLGDGTGESTSAKAERTRDAMNDQRSVPLSSAVSTCGTSRCTRRIVSR